MLILYNKYNGHKRENAKEIFFSSTIRVNPVKFWVLFPVNGFMHVLTNTLIPLPPTIPTQSQGCNICRAFLE